MAAGTLTEAVVEEVAENLEEVAAVTRRLNPSLLSGFAGGLGLGIAVGFIVGHKYKKMKYRMEAFEASEKEVEEIRETYYRKTVAAEQKPDAEEIIRERGYVTPPDTVSHLRSLKAPVPVSEPPSVLDREALEERLEQEAIQDWDFPTELAQRSPETPYVIHRNEFTMAESSYEQVSYTYYAADDVLTGEDDKPLPHADQVVGMDNLKWGHGSEDSDVVFVRNDKLMLEMEITRSPKSYEQEVLGLEHSERMFEPIRKRSDRLGRDHAN